MKAKEKLMQMPTRGLHTRLKITCSIKTSGQAGDIDIGIVRLPARAIFIN